MTKHPHRALTDGRLKDNRVGSGNHSNYLVTNDNVQTMDLPRNMLGPRQPSQGRKTPLLIPPLKYIVYNNPQVSYDFLINKGYNVEPTIPSTLQFAHIFIKDNGDPGILEFVKEAHPDKETILKAVSEDKKESNFSDTNNNTNPSTTTSATTNNNSSKETTEPKSESKAEEWIKLNTKTIIIILVIVVFFLLINRATK
jgi:hypothetical protein